MIVHYAIFKDLVSKGPMLGLGPRHTIKCGAEQFDAASEDWDMVTCPDCLRLKDEL